MPSLCAGPSGGGRSCPLLLLAQLHEEENFSVPVNNENGEAGSGHPLKGHWSSQLWVALGTLTLPACVALGEGQGSLGSLVEPWECVHVGIWVLVMPPEAAWTE